MGAHQDKHKQGTEIPWNMHTLQTKQIEEIVWITFNKIGYIVALSVWLSVFMTCLQLNLKCRTYTKLLTRIFFIDIMLKSEKYDKGRNRSYILKFGYSPKKVVIFITSRPGRPIYFFCEWSKFAHFWSNLYFGRAVVAHQWVGVTFLFQHRQQVCWAYSMAMHSSEGYDDVTCLKM